MPNEDWSEREIALIIADYLDMLSAELRGEPYNKTEHRRALLPPEITPIHIDFAERDAANRKLGMLGEEWALTREKQRLAELGCPDLVKHVEWVSDLRGDGLGFDILSRDTDDADLFIKVKTTNLAAQFSFFLTSNELNTSLRNAERYRLYRIFHFSHEPACSSSPALSTKRVTSVPPATSPPSCHKHKPLTALRRACSHSTKSSSHAIIETVVCAVRVSCEEKPWTE